MNRPANSLANSPAHTELAHAKVNLDLRVLYQREDGFHEITTRMAPISLADRLEFYPAEQYTLESEVSDIPLDETNLITKVVRVFESETGISVGWRIVLKKTIPHGAGLGGGSSDAAAAMRALNQLENANLSSEKMAELLAKIGSDIPFFVYNTMADCSGRGELVAPVLDWDHEAQLLLLKPNFGVNTPEAYRAWSQAQALPGICYEAQVVDWGRMANDLEKPVFMKHRFLAELKMWLLAQPEVNGAMMSGSGSTMMAVIHPENGQSLLQRARVEMDPSLWGEVVSVIPSLRNDL